MQLSRFSAKNLVKGLGVCTIISLGLIGYTEPSTTQVTTPQAQPSAVPDGSTASSSTGTETVTLDEAADRIEQAIDNDANLKQFDLDVDDEDNAIVLQGDVKDASQKTLAESLAKQAAPNVAIANEIEVKP